MPEGEVRGVVGGVAFSKPRCERGSFDYGVPEGEVGGAAFSPDGKTLAAGYEVRSVQTWSVPGSQDVAWSGGVVLWDVAARTRLVEEPLAVPEGGVGEVAFSPDGKTLAAGYGVRSDHKDVAWSGGVVLWDVAARTRLVEEPLAVTEGWVEGVAFSPDGKTLAAGYTGTAGSGGVVLWDVAGARGWSRSPWPCPRVGLGGRPSAPMARPWPRGTK